MSERPSIGARMKALREFRGMTLTELADKTKLSKGYISTLESDSGANPTLDVLMKIASALDVTVGEIVGNSKRQARATALDIPEEQLPPALLELVKERRSHGEPLEPATVRWLAHANHRGKRPVTKEQFKMLLMVMGDTK